MFSRTFEYTGYDGQPHKDTWWFNLSEAELYKLELSNLGGMNGMMNRLLRESKPGEIVEVFESLILSAVGERSVDGRKFIKNQEIRDDFYQSKAYSDLFVELVSSGEKLAEFLKGAIPAEVAAELAKAEEEKSKDKPVIHALPADENPTDPKASVVSSADH